MLASRLLLPCPGRNAARSGALQNRDPGFFLPAISNRGPASAVHRFTLHRVRDTERA
jgi:hypothetical protein